MELTVTEIHPAESPKLLNTEWFILKNGGEKTFHTKNCTLSVAKPGQKKRRDIGTMDPGVQLSPGERVRVITGNPGRKAHGKAPEDDVQNYHLFLGSQVLQGSGCQVTLSLRSLVLVQAKFEKSAKNGVAAAADS